MSNNYPLHLMEVSRFSAKTIRILLRRRHPHQGIPTPGILVMLRYGLAMRCVVSTRLAEFYLRYAFSGRPLLATLVRIRLVHHPSPWDGS